MYDVIVIGAGTAGMTAGIYARRAGKTVLIIEEKNYGGQIINTPEVENYPGISKVSGFIFANNLYNQTRELGAEFKFEEVIKIQNNSGYKVVVTNKTKYQGKTVIIATGAKNRPLGVNNEDKLTGAGVSYCATCDGAFFKDQTVAVVGGGDVALEDALYLSNICKNVYLIHRRDGLRGAKVLQNKVLEKENITFMPFYEVTKICGQNKVEAVELKQNQTGETKTIDLSGVFIAIGMEPQSSLVKDLVKEDPAGYVEAGEDCRTSADGIYVAGDVRSKSLRQVVTAVADGAVAIASIEQDFARE